MHHNTYSYNRERRYSKVTPSDYEMSPTSGIAKKEENDCMCIPHTEITFQSDTLSSSTTTTKKDKLNNSALQEKKTAGTFLLLTRSLIQEESLV